MVREKLMKDVETTLGMALTYVMIIYLFLFINNTNNVERKIRWVQEENEETKCNDDNK